MTLSDLFMALYERYGVNLSIFFDDFDRDAFLLGIRYTAWLSLASIAFSLALGVVGAWCEFSGSRIGRRLTSLYVQIFRNTPPLIQLYFFYFAVGPTVSMWFESPTPVLSNVTWAIVSLSLYAGAFNVEIFRSGIEAVPQATMEAAEALGLSKWQMFSRIAMPLAMRISIPAVTNNLVNLIKTTTNAFAIAVPELLYASSQIWSEQLNTLEMMFVLLLFYAITIGAFVVVMGFLERKFAVPGWGQS